MAAAVTMAISNRAWLGVFIALVFGCTMIGMGYLVMKMLLFDLVDEVWDDGDHLVVKNGRQEDRIKFATIMNVSYMPARPDRITLTLREPCRFGKEVTFSPVPRSVFVNPFSKNPIVQELIERVDRARRGMQGSSEAHNR